MREQRHMSRTDREIGQAEDLERIADALERIADALEADRYVSSSIGEPMQTVEMARRP